RARYGVLRRREGPDASITLSRPGTLLKALDNVRSSYIQAAGGTSCGIPGIYASLRSEAKLARRISCVSTKAWMQSHVSDSISRSRSGLTEYGTEPRYVSPRGATSSRPP